MLVYCSIPCYNTIKVLLRDSFETVTGKDVGIEWEFI